MSDRTESVLVLLTVPAHWQRLPVAEIEKKLRKQPHLTHFLAKEVKRWAGTGALDLSGLQKFIDDRTGGRGGDRPTPSIDNHPSNQGGGE